MKYLTLLAVLCGALTSTAFAGAQENLYKFTCGKKEVSIYSSSQAVFINANKLDDVKYRETTTGYLIDFREYAEMGGTYTQYQLAKINDKKTLTSQWLNADGDPLRASDVVSCTQNADTKGKMPDTKSVMEMIGSGELE